MPLDAITLTALSRELDQTLAGARVDKVLQPERDEIDLVLRGPAGGGRLVLATGGHPRIHLTAAGKENPAVPPMFCMLLRKHLGSSKLLRVRQPGLERMVELVFESRDELGQLREETLVLELLGRSANLILRDGQGRIIDCLRRVELGSGQSRQILPGFFYTPPVPQDKPDFPQVKALWPLLAGENREAKAADALLRRVGGLSPLCCRELVYRACGQVDARLFELEPDRLQQEFSALQALYREGRFVPMLLLEGEEPKDFSFQPVRQYEGAWQTRTAESFSALLDTFYTQRDQLLHQRQRSAELTKLVSSHRARLARKLDAQRAELLEARNRETLRREGDLIMANLHQLRRGDRVLRCPDFYDPEQRETEIRLDPRLSPQENAARRYKSYAKRKTAEKVLTQQLRQGAEELQYMESVLEELERAQSARDLQEIREELQEAGLVRRTQSGRKQAKPPALRPMEFRSSTGVRFWAGRNNRQNDLLTTRFADKRDLWLHTQKIHGCHVIVDCSAGAPDEQTITEAAIVAATFSKASAGRNVPVDYCPVRQVKKPGGAKPGMVIYENYRTAYVTPDPALVKRLEVRP